MTLTPHDLHELAWWDRQPSLADARAKIQLYLDTFERDAPAMFEELLEADSILEIGMGPAGGFLAKLGPAERVAVDPLLDEYRKRGFFNEPGAKTIDPIFENIIMCPEYFGETWGDSGQAPLIFFGEQLTREVEIERNRFDAVISIDSLDHGDMSFHLLPKIADLLRVGGLFFLYVQLRRADQLNRGHDHCLTMEEFEEWRQIAGLKCEHLRDFPRDIDEQPSDGKGGTIRAIMAVLRKAAG